MEYDLHNLVNAVLALQSANINTDTTTNGEVIDTRDFESMIFVIKSGAVVDGTFTALIEEAPDVGGSPGTFVTVDPALVLGPLPVFGARDVKPLPGWVRSRRRDSFDSVSFRQERL